MTIRLIRLTGKTAAIPVASGPSNELAAITSETNAATARARAGRSNPLRRLVGIAPDLALPAVLNRANPPL